MDLIQKSKEQTDGNPHKQLRTAGKKLWVQHMNCLIIFFQIKEVPERP